MTYYAQPVKEFVFDSYQLISASSPTTPLHGSDTLKGVQFLNQLIQFYSASGLLLTVAQYGTYQLAIGQQYVTFADPTFLPAPNIAMGRLANLEEAWLDLDGVTYPLINESRNVFYSSYKYVPQLGLPRFCILDNQTNYTLMTLYPGCSEAFNLHFRGKFQMPILTENSTMSGFPDYFIRFLSLALARDLAFYKGRSSAWDEKLQAMYVEAKNAMESVTAVNLLIDTSNESYLNGSWRVRAGI